MVILRDMFGQNTVKHFADAWIQEFILIALYNIILLFLQSNSYLQRMTHKYSASV